MTSLTFFEVIIFHMNNNEDVSREVQTFKELSYGEPAEVLIQSGGYFED